MKTKPQLLQIWLLLIGLLAGLNQADAQTSFNLSANYPVAPGISFDTPYAVTAFMNVDGRVDLATANADLNTLTVLTNDGSGNFSSNATYAVGNYPNSVAAADVNGDGYVDLICANQQSQNVGAMTNIGTLTVLTNNGSGGFGSNATYTVGSVVSCPFSVVAADLNGDGKPDLICGHYSNSGPNGIITVLTNDGSGGFVLETNISAGQAYYVQSVTTADVNGDGKPDLITANFLSIGSSALCVLTNNGNGVFKLSSSPGAGGYEPASVTAADVNGDGKVDLIFANYSGVPFAPAITILTNNGSGGFVLYTNIPKNGVAFDPDFVTAADVNGDGYVDLILANQGTPGGNNSSLIVLTNNGSGVFVQAAYIAMSGSGANWIAAADVNGDGKVDFACANRYSNSVSVFFNASIFPPPTATPPLNINPSGSGMQVSWPSPSAGWSLQQNQNLTTMPWGPGGYSGYTISDNGTTKSLTIPSPPGNMFFRLLHP